MANMANLPAKQPRTFRSSYTPIAAAGTDAQVTHLARLLASQMTSAGVGIGAKTKGIKPQSQQSEEPPLLSTSPVVRDPRKRRREAETLEEKETKKRKKEKSTRPESSATSEADLEKSMVELAYLGSLLGMPNILDPEFPLAYAAFFGSITPTGSGGGGETEGESALGMGKGSIKLEDQTAHVHTANHLLRKLSRKKEENPNLSCLRFLSYYCLLYPSTSWCKKSN